MADLRRLVKLDESGAILVSTAALSGIWKCSDEAIRKWHLTGMPKVSTGWWDLAAVTEWRGMSCGVSTKDLSDEARKLKADAKYRELKAAREQRMLEVLEGQYIDKNEIESEWARRVVEIKSSLLMLAKTIGKEFSDPDIRRTVEKVVNASVYEYLENYARTGIYTPKGKPRRVAAKGKASVEAT